MESVSFAVCVLTGYYIFLALLPMWLHNSQHSPTPRKGYHYVRKGKYFSRLIHQPSRRMENL